MPGTLLDQTSGLAFRKGVLLLFYKQLRFQYFWDMTLNLPMLYDEITAVSHRRGTGNPVTRRHITAERKPESMLC